MVRVKAPSAVIAGDENYEVDSGTVHLEGEDLLDLDPDQRAHREYSCHFNTLLKSLVFLFRTL